MTAWVITLLATGLGCIVASAAVMGWIAGSGSRSRWRRRALRAEEELRRLRGERRRRQAALLSAEASREADTVLLSAVDSGHARRSDRRLGRSRRQ